MTSTHRTCIVVRRLCASMCQSYMPQNINDKWIMASSVGTAFCRLIHMLLLLKYYRTIYCTPANKFTPRFKFMHTCSNRRSNLIRFHQYWYVCQKITILELSDIHRNDMIHYYGLHDVHRTSMKIP